MRKRERNKIIYCRKVDWYEKTLDVLDELYTTFLDKNYSKEAYGRASDDLNGLAIWANEEVHNTSNVVLASIRKMARLYKACGEAKTEEKYNKLVAEYDLEIEKYPKYYDAMTTAMRVDLGIKTKLSPLQYASYFDEEYS